MKIKTVFELCRRIEESKIKYPESDWNDTFSDGQIKSKTWLLDNLKDLNLGTVFILGGWFGTLSYGLFNSDVKLDKIRSFDIDDTSTKIAEIVNQTELEDSWKFKSTTADVNEFKYPLKYTTYRKVGTPCELKEIPNTIINTSSEHMTNEWFDNVPKGTLVIIQTNNFFEIPEHINCCKDLNDTKSKYKFSKILYSGENKLEKYTRYMIIGYK